MSNQCERCGADGEPVIDPYALDLDGVELRVVLSGRCLQARCDDI